MVVCLDQLSRSEDLQDKLRLTQWDLVVVDEAHKLSATWYGSRINETKRFKLGKLLGGITRHLLLMTATPHNGKEDLLKFDGTKLFPERRATTVNYKLSDLEAALYHAQ